MVQPKLSDLYTARQIAKKWYRSLIGGAILNAVVGSSLFTTRTAWTDPVAWVQLVVTALAGVFLVEKSLATEDYRELPMIDPTTIKEPRP